MTKQLLVGVALALALCSMMAHALLRCENFDTYIAGTVYSNITGFPPGRYISQSPVRFDGQKFFGDPAGRYYGSLYIAAASNVSSFFTSPSVSGSVLDIRDMTIEFDFRNMARSDQPKYIRFEFYDFGTLQNLRVNNGTVYKGSLVSIEEAVNSNIYWFPKRQRRFVSNLGELFVANNATRMERFWIGGDRLYIDNVCWDTDWHDHPKVDAPSGDVRLLAPALMAAVAGLVSLFLL